MWAAGGFVLGLVCGLVAGSFWGFHVILGRLDVMRKDDVIRLERGPNFRRPSPKID